MATGMAIMGFGGGAMIGSPLANLLMNHFKTPTSVGVWQTFLALGGDLFRLHDGRRVRLSRAADGLAARRLDAARRAHNAMITQRQRPSQGRAQDAAVLADLGGAVPECVGRHRRARHGLADAAGNLRRLADRQAGARLLGARCRPEGGDRDDRGGLRRPACRCSTSAAASSGPRCRTRSAARSTYFIFFGLGIAALRARPRASPIWARGRCSSPRSA